MANVKTPVRVYKTFRKIGNEVKFISTGEGNPRNGEGSFLRLQNGSILFAYTEYVGEDYHDACRAHIVGIESADEGSTWTEPRVLLDFPAEKGNVMSVSLLRMNNGDVGLFYAQHVVTEVYPGLCLGKMIRSSDEGKTWSSPVATTPQNYYVVNNDRVLRLQNGDIFFSAALHNNAANHSKTNEKIARGVACFFRSTDDGKTFLDEGVVLEAPFPDVDHVGLQEPGLFQFEDGTLWAYFRTRLGCQYRSLSTDNGHTWSAPAPDFRFTSPRAPMLVKTVGKYTVAVFNPVPEGAYTAPPFGMDRTPLMLSVSEDGGKTFPRSYLLEDDPKNAYCYPAVIEIKGGFLVAYYHSNGTGQFLNCTKMTKVLFDEIKE